MRALLLVALLLALALAGGCGKKGPLYPPEPTVEVTAEP